MTSRVSLSIKHLKKIAPHCPVDVCQRWIPGANIRRDLFLLFDLIWLSLSMDGTDGQTVGIQVTDSTNYAAHVKKMHANPIAAQWVACGNGIVIHCWDKRGPRGGRKVWTLTEHELTFVRIGNGKPVPWIQPTTV